MRSRNLPPASGHLSFPPNRNRDPVADIPERRQAGGLPQQQPSCPVCLREKDQVLHPRGCRFGSRPVVGLVQQGSKSGFVDQRLSQPACAGPMPLEYFAQAWRLAGPLAFEARRCRANNIGTRRLSSLRGILNRPPIEVERPPRRFRNRYR